MRSHAGRLEPVGVLVRARAREVVDAPAPTETREASSSCARPRPGCSPPATGTRRTAPNAPNARRGRRWRSPPTRRTPDGSRPRRPARRRARRRDGRGGSDGGPAAPREGRPERESSRASGMGARAPRGAKTDGPGVRARATTRYLTGPDIHRTIVIRNASRRFLGIRRRSLPPRAHSTPALLVRSRRRSRGSRSVSRGARDEMTTALSGDTFFSRPVARIRPSPRPWAR